jgi:peroxiredoxin
MSWLSFIVMLVAAVSRFPVEPPAPKEPPFVAEIRGLQEQLDKVGQENVYREYKSKAEQEAARQRIARLFNEVGDPLARKIVDLARPHAADPAAVDALTFVLQRQGPCHRNSKAATDAADLLAKFHPKDPRTFDAADRSLFAPRPWTVPLLRAVAAADLPRERKAESLFSLAECLKVETEFASWFPELYLMDPEWAIVQQRRFGKEFIDRLKAEHSANEVESVRLFNEVAARYGDVPFPGGIKSTYGEFARGGAFAVKNLGLGKPAPDFTCTDSSGRTVRLHELKGRVVILDFWFVACVPCREQFPHLRQLSEAHAGKPLAIVGITADEDRDKWQEFLNKEKLPWSQWHSGRGGVVAEWDVRTFPTLYVIDHKGIIRDRGGLRQVIFDRLVKQLVVEAATDGGRGN